MPSRCANSLTLLLTAALAVNVEFMSARQNQPADTSQPAARDLREAERLQQEAERHIEARQFKEAAAKLEEALSIRKQRLGDSHPDVALSMGSLAAVAYNLGDYPRAEALAAETLKIREATLGANHALVAESLSDLASMYLVRGDYVRPEPLYLRALKIYDSVQTGDGATEARTLAAGVLNNLALLYHRRGDYGRAESNYLRVITIREAVSGPDDPSVAEAAANLGGVYYASAQYAKAIETLTRALRIQEKRLPAAHPALATSSFNLAAVYLDQGDYASAEVLFQRALTIDEGAVEPQHPRLAIRLLGLAEVLRLEGEYARAEPLYERALTIRDQALGQGHPLFAETVIGRSLLRYARGDLISAVELLERGAALREDTVALVLTTGTESAKRLYLRTLDDESDIALTLHLRGAPTAARAAALALTHVVQRKGRSIDATADQMATLRRRLDGDDRELLGRLAQAQARLANLVLRGVSTDDQRKTVATLRAEIQQSEQSISSRSSEFRGVQRTTLADIQAALPADAVLLEFVAYRPFLIRNARRTAFAAPHYAVYALRREGIVASADLGEVAVVDREIDRLRVSLSTTNGRDVRQAAQALYRRVLAPVTPAIGSAQRLVISPDGALNLIPFAAVMTDEGRYLVENHVISYVTSGRDLARLRRPGDVAVAAGPPVVIANPSFDGLRVPPAATAAASGGTDQALLGDTLKFDPLPGTGEEAVAITKLLTGARVFTGTSATETVLKQVNMPAILHIATHGFFLRGAKSSAAATRGLTAAPAQSAQPVGVGEDALLLSGLAMAGANQRWSGEGEDGILTALEATSLDLRGTRLVVLSACETGVGDARSGEGVYGLRRALVLAGSESQVMSLWQVSDTATRDLMIAYYRRLRAGEGRADALRQVQLDMLRTGAARAHPFYWASFIESGDWRPAFDSR